MKKMLAALLALTMVLGLAACGSGDAGTNDAEQPASVGDGTSETGQNGARDTDGSAQEKDTTLTIGTMTAPITFNSSGADSNPYNAMVFNTLIDFDEDGEICGVLAEEYAYVDDYTLKITIHDNVYFTEGQHLTADDVLYSLRYWATETVHSESFSAYDLDASYTEGETVLYIVYKELYGPAITDLSNYFIYSQEWMESISDDAWWDSPNGTGAYVCTANVDGQYTSFERKDEWWGELPECTAVTYKYYGESSTMFIDLEQGVLDLAYNVSNTDAARLIAGTEENTDLVYQLQKINSPANIKFCEVCEYWQDERVRKAFALAMDYEGIATAAFGELWVEMGSAIGDGCNYYYEVGGYETDLDRAKELMAEAGYADGFEVRAIIVNSAVDMATAVQACAAQIGITIHIESYDPGVAVPMWIANETDLYISAGAESNATKDPYSSLNIFGETTTMTACRITQPEFNEYFYEGLYTIDPEVRAEAYQKLQQWIYDTYWLVTVCDPTRCNAWDGTKISSVYFANPGRPVVTYIHFA